MKRFKTSLLSFFIFTALSVNAQISFGVKGGLNFSNASAGNENMVLNTKTNLGFHLGLLAEYMLNENMGIQSGLSFSTAGYKVLTDMDLLIIKIKSDSKINLKTLQVPLHLAYSLKFAEQCKATIHAGPYAAYILSGEKTIKADTSIADQNASGKQSINLYDKDGNLKRFDVGLGFGLALAYNNCFIDFGYDFGLVNLLKDKKNSSLKLNNIYLSLGYKF